MERKGLEGHGNELVSGLIHGVEVSGIFTRSMRGDGVSLYQGNMQACARQEIRGGTPGDTTTNNDTVPTTGVGSHRTRPRQLCCSKQSLCRFFVNVQCR